MKKISLMILALMLVSTSVFAGGWIPGKCGAKLNSEAYNNCAQKYKVWNPTGGPEGTGSYEISIPTASAEFKTCEAQELAFLKQLNGCR